ncbi:MAG: HesA/MoeB/ThiF family protein [Betaproteobacteria bacterium]|nr:HesA/MoeB/ThiF family protein [Betaproteobacteria bacterium]NBT75366.1 HesA/MoeB/ThiF family protein [Betaproteobacteria bacterium]NBY13299.1 HesA/MoeB/ThiF family protein [Betaproteobacteria bacterium]NCA16835.1 HesA/MoeB/ThiF family protein [Betaproteobacteria bacterium]
MEELVHSRTLLLSEVSERQLTSLRRSRVLIVGAGGLGCPAAQCLAAAGVGAITLVDGDTVDASNLPRQTLFGPEDIGQPKPSVARARLAQTSPACAVVAVCDHAHADNLPELLAQSDLVLDCTDRFQTRQLINRLCVQTKKPLVAASVVQWSGQLMVIDLNQLPEAGCYACLFPPEGSSAQSLDAACGAFGVFPTAAGLLGTLQAHVALMVLLGLSSTPSTFLLLDTKSLRLEAVGRLRRPDCPICGEGACASD